MTNKTANIYRENVDWQGKKTLTLIGSYDVWLEEAVVTRLALRGSRKSEYGSEVIVGRGTIFLYDEVNDLENCIFEIDGKQHEAVNVDIFWDDDGSFHHAEITYR